MLTEKIKFVVREAYVARLKRYENKYIKYLKKIVSFVSNIDVIKSCAKTAIHYNYSRPEIGYTNDMSDTSGTSVISYIDTKQIRHPIIERIQTNLKYIPNDVKIGTDDCSGILLFGTNSSGKSSLMKSIGLNIIMAQAGNVCISR